MHPCGSKSQVDMGLPFVFVKTSVRVCFLHVPIFCGFKLNQQENHKKLGGTRKKTVPPHRLSVTVLGMRPKTI